MNQERSRELMGMERILLGAVIGVGAVAAAPFTGGGSVLGAASLAGSLAGVGTCLSAVAAGTVGAAMADAIGESEDAGALLKSYNEGFKDAKKKFKALEEVLEEEGMEESPEQKTIRKVSKKWGPML